MDVQVCASGTHWRLGDDAWGREMKIININNREKKKGKGRRKENTDLFPLVCELDSAAGMGLK